MSRKRGQKAYTDVLEFLNPKIPSEIEDDILGAFATYSIESDMTSADLRSYFEDLQMPRELTKMVNDRDLCIEGTNIVSFEKLLKTTFHLLVFMNNAEIVDTQWSMLVQACGRDAQFPHVALRSHVLSIKDLQKVANSISMDNGRLIEMMSCATNGTRVYVTWLDFAFLLGKLGHLVF
ncbi:LANO_0D03862g1_1 [Lachancea nothofagi CBS 11611]|uniref:LANO_0D03862g1_1 n=1 Tax=Lachancea nothofagi CBS 11611 TaxID=1266666 RepID=A0A1G4JFM0_9SACH|nr:LANO_0D03862g1_1 [Lachancea nothofagi CBS 11611]